MAWPDVAGHGRQTGRWGNSPAFSMETTMNETDFRMAALQAAIDVGANQGDLIKVADEVFSFLCRGTEFASPSQPEGSPRKDPEPHPSSCSN